MSVSILYLLNIEAKSAIAGSLVNHRSLCALLQRGFGSFLILVATYILFRTINSGFQV